MDTLRSIPATDFATEITENTLPVFDMRKQGEWDSSHLSSATHVCLTSINENLAKFPKDENFYVHCAGGYRSVIASSILKMRGYHNLTDVAGGYDAIQPTHLPKT